MPDRTTFADTEIALAGERYCATLFRQLIRWTAPASRANRLLDMRFGNDAPYVEELVVEIGAAFLCAALGITPESNVERTDCLAHWLRLLRSDKEAIFRAGTDAQEAFEYLAYLATRNESGESDHS